MLKTSEINLITIWLLCIKNVGNIFGNFSSCLLIPSQKLFATGLALGSTCLERKQVIKPIFNRTPGYRKSCLFHNARTAHFMTFICKKNAFAPKKTDMLRDKTMKLNIVFYGLCLLMSNHDSPTYT